MDGQMSLAEKRAAARRCVARLWPEEGIGDTKAERDAYIERITHYTPAEARKKIFGIMESDRTVFFMENGTDELVAYTKDEMIDLIKRSTLR